MSKKILLTVAGILVALSVTSLFILRNDVQSILLKAELENKYKEVEVDNFNALDFSSYWTVKVKQGRAYKVELALEGNTGVIPRVENKQGTLYFNAEANNEQQNTQNKYARITTPELHTIKAKQGTKIHLKNFDSDSIHIVLEDGGAFIGEENKFIYTSFNTSGKVSFEIIDDPFK